MESNKKTTYEQRTEMLEELLEAIMERKRSAFTNPMDYVNAVHNLIDIIDRRKEGDNKK